MADEQLGQEFANLQSELAYLHMQMPRGSTTAPADRPILLLAVTYWEIDCCLISFNKQSQHRLHLNHILLHNMYICRQYVVIL
jgi:hypothetical protein